MRIRIEQKKQKVNFSSVMTDISFLLIIFFIIALVFIVDFGLFITLPQKESTPLELKPDEAIEVIITDYSTVIIDGKKTDLQNVSEEIKQVLQNKIDPVAVLNVGTGISYQHVLSIVEIIKTEGVSTFSILTIKTEDPKPIELEGQETG